MQLIRGSIETLHEMLIGRIVTITTEPRARLSRLPTEVRITTHEAGVMAAENRMLVSDVHQPWRPLDVGRRRLRPMR